MSIALNVLIVEDTEEGALIVASELKRGGYEPVFKRANSPRTLLGLLESEEWDVIIADHGIRGFTGLDALKLCRESGVDRPFILISNNLPKEAAVEAMVAGVHDCVWKQNLSRLVPAVRRELARAESRREHGRVERELALWRGFESSILKAIPYAVLGIRNRTIVFANEGTEKVFGWTANDLIGENTRLLYRSEEDYEEIGRRFYGALRAQGSYQEDFPCRRKDGSPILCMVSAARVGASLTDKEIVALYEDVTEAKRTEEAVRESERKYRSIFENSVEGIFRADPEGRVTSVNPAAARIFGYETAEAIMHSRTAQAPVLLFARHKDWARHRILLRRDGEVKGFETKLVTRDGSVIWCSVTMRAVRNSAGEVLHYEGTVADITSRKTAEEGLRGTMRKLRKSLMGTIRAVSLTVETKDPYTAGHQKRVSSLARSIAEELALSGDEADAIFMAGAIHDIGKMAVPAEILTKPTELSRIEMNLIRIHPQTGYDILKDAGLPFPVAEIVLQHHERLDGSGYPKGLAGDQILFPARIIAVADVVEAIASHRPYRPAYGLDRAMDEIERHRGSLYDADVVDACTRLCREKGFAFG